MDVSAPPADDDDFKIKGKGKNLTAALHDIHKDAPQDTCVICLERITERAVAVPCNHLNFDFLCLASWLEEQPSCPLCKAPTTEVQYDWRSPDHFQTYDVIPKKDPTRPNCPPASVRSSVRGHHTLPRRGNNRRYTPQVFPDSALSFRRHIYSTKSFSLHVGANRRSEYINFTPNTFATTPHLQTRARIFMRRELQVFAFLQHPNIEFLIEYLVAVLKKIDVKSSEGAAQELVAEFLGIENAALFLHELESWLRSPYERLPDWDRNVQYALPATKESDTRGARSNA